MLSPFGFLVARFAFVAVVQAAHSCSRFRSFVRRLLGQGRNVYLPLRFCSRKRTLRRTIHGKVIC